MRDELKRNIGLFKHIIKHCNGVASDIKRFGDDEEVFSKDETYQRAIGMGILQIGELAKGLSKNLREANYNLKTIIEARDAYAHGYWNVSRKDIWSIAKNAVGDILKFAEEYLKNNKNQGGMVA